MAYQSGHGGAVTGPGIAANVRSWELTDLVQIHDTTVLSSTYRARLAGIPDWTTNLQVLLDSAADMTAATVVPGGAVDLTLTAVVGGVTTYSGTGIIREVRLSRDANSEISGTMIVDGNGALTRPAGA